MLANLTSLRLIYLACYLLLLYDWHWD